MEKDPGQDTLFLQKVINAVFTELGGLLMQLRNDEYTAPSRHLFNATIGQHVRHIVELFQCLQKGYDTGIVNYDKRNRDISIETDKTVALGIIDSLLNGMHPHDKSISMEASFGSHSEVLSIQSNYLRELVYNLEHAIHHMALIRVGVNELTDIVVSERFGVAPSTIQHRESCAQ